jgi:energy-coupling factor transporter ATP-binding protein EcfA2
MEHKILIPIDGVQNEISSNHSFVIIGANGSGKSRLGKYIEDNSADKNTHRISAQRALNIPDFVSLKSFEEASDLLLYGTTDTNTVKQKIRGVKWGWNGYENKLINDYDNLLSSVFALKNKENDEFVKKCKICEADGKPHPDAPITVIDCLIEIWQCIMPHRKIVLSDAKVSAKHHGLEYHGKDLSDGERVALYLLAQSLCIPDGYTIIIDEPELHLHKSIMTKLWDKIEEYCPNKTFVYITHDLDFASSRKTATKIWAKAFDGTNWDIQILPEVENIPENLMIEILGNRKDVLFVEGERGSYDFELYKHIYSNYYILPCGSCSTVIQNTKAFREMRELHKLNIYGIIDHDYRTDAEIESYKSNGIYVLEVAEIENLFCLEGVIKIIAEHQAFPDIENKINTVKSAVFTAFNLEYDNQLCSICEREIQHKLKNYKKGSGNTKEDLRNRLTALLSSIDIDQLHLETKKHVDDIIEQQDYNKLLGIFNRKNLHKRISKELGLTSTEEDNFAQLVLRLLNTDKKERIISEIAAFTPALS